MKPLGVDRRIATAIGGRVRINIASKMFALALVSIAAATWTGPAAAQFGAPISAQAAQDMQSKGYTPPRIPAAQIEQLAKQPDFQGDWSVTSPVQGNSLGVVFDPFNVHVPYEVTAGLFGPIPGTYMTKIPYNAEYLKRYMKIVADALAGKSHDTYALCVPYGMPRFMGGAAVGFDILQNAEVISMQNWYDNEQRRIFLDARPHPSMDPMGGENPRTRTGHSVGHWEGDVLVVDTANMIAGVYDDTEAPYSDRIHLVERIRLIASNVLADEMTIDDPVALTSSWTVTRYFNRRLAPPPKPASADGDLRQPGAAQPAPFHDLADRVCHETIDMSKGFQSVILPQEIEARQKKKTTSQAKSDAGHQR